MLLLTGAHIRAARGLLGLDQAKLAAAAGVSATTLRKLEQTNGQGEPDVRLGTLRAIHATLEGLGVEFLNGDAPGVRLRPRDGKGLAGD